MENAHQKSAAEFKILDGQKTDFNLIYSNLVYIATKALEVFKKDPMNFILAFAIPIVVGGVVEAVLLPMFFAGLIYGGGIGALVALLVWIVCSLGLFLVAYIALTKAIVNVAKGEKIDLRAVFSFGFANAVNFIVLNVKVILLLLTGWKKFVGALLSQIFFVEKNGNVEEAIKASQTVAEGKTTTLIWNLIAVGLASSIASYILTIVWGIIFGRVSYYLLDLGSYVINGLVTPFVVICQFVLREELNKHAAHHAAAHTEAHHG